MKIKVCGMRENMNVEELVRLQPEYIGFIFYINSPRYVSKATPNLPLEIRKTGVFVNSPINYIEEIIKNHDLQCIQLHGNETPNYCQSVKSFGVEVVKAFGVKNPFDFDILIPYENSCDYYLFDTRGKLPGGNSYRFDWKILKHYPFKKQFFLSGGIGLEHISKIKNLLKNKLPIYAIDINSKFEIEPGLKNIELIEKFKDKLYEL